MRYPTLPGIPDVYYECSYGGHKATPGKYMFTLTLGGQQVSTTAEILSNPLYINDLLNYNAYHRVMLEMEKEFTQMHQMVNTIFAKKEQLEQLLQSIPPEAPFKPIRVEGDALVKKMKTWDEAMVQRKSKAYDDVENFPNKFTANYIFLINQTESDIPVVNNPSFELKKALDAEWAILKATATRILENDVPALNKKLFDLGIGGIWKN
jgi:hypothetical protein